MVNSASGAEDGGKVPPRAEGDVQTLLGPSLVLAVTRGPQAGSGAEETSWGAWRGVDPPPKPKDNCPRPQ